MLTRARQYQIYAAPPSADAAPPADDQIRWQQPQSQPWRMAALAIAVLAPFFFGPPLTVEAAPTQPQGAVSQPTSRPQSRAHFAGHYFAPTASDPVASGDTWYLDQTQQPPILVPSRLHLYPTVFHPPEVFVAPPVVGTVWVEMVATATGWTDGIPENDGSEDFFIDFLFEGTGFFAIAADYTEHSVGAASYTEHTSNTATYVEHTA